MPRPASTRTPLSRDRISEAALDLIDEEGIEGLSLRRLGRRLGVEAMSLYHHVANREAVLDLAAARLLSEAQPATADRSNWRGWLRQTAFAYYALARKRPRAFPLLAARRFNTPEALRWFEELLGVLDAAGFAPADQARVFRALGAVVNGAGLATAATLLDQTRPDATVWRGQFQDGRFPHVAAVAPHLSAEATDELFAFALEAMLSGLARELGRA